MVMAIWIVLGAVAIALVAMFIRMSGADIDGSEGGEQ
jgi:hypothetical protein